MGTKSRFSALLVVPIALLALAGCGVGKSINAWEVAPAGTADSETTATATPEPVSLVEDVDGSGVIEEWELGADSNSDGKLSEFEKQVVGKKKPADYTMPDGSVVTLDPSEPLPESIIQIVREEGAGLSDLGQDEYIESSHAFAESQGALLGRPIVILISTVSSANGNTYYVARPSNAMYTGYDATTDRDAAIASAQSWADARGSTLIIID